MIKSEVAKSFFSNTKDAFRCFRLQAEQVLVLDAYLWIFKIITKTNSRDVRMKHQ